MSDTLDTDLFTQVGHIVVGKFLCNKVSSFSNAVVILYNIFYGFNLPNMPAGMPSLRRSRLPAQTIHESLASLQFLLFPFRAILSMRAPVYYRARRGEW